MFKKTFVTLATLAIGSALLFTANCSDDDEGPHTAILVTVRFNPQMYTIDQFRFEGYLDDGTQAFEPGNLPDPPGQLFTTSEETVIIVLSDLMDGEAIRLRVHGLNQGQIEGSGQENVTAALGQTVEVTVTLGDPAICGDQAVRTGIEDCDDGNLDDSDGCSLGCVTEEGWICPGEPSVCSPICGDGLVRGSEPCDDFNFVSDDGCSDVCAVEDGWQCNTDEPTVCTPICGDGLIRGGEACDDGNLDIDDGCAADCTIEAGWSCSGEPSLCLFPCSDHVDCDYVCDTSAGACVREDDIMFVDCANTCPGSGVVSDPFCEVSQTVADATQTGQFIVVMPGTCNEFVGVTNAVNIVGLPGAIIESQNCPAVEISGVSARLENLVIQGEWTGSRYDGGGVTVFAGAEATLVGNRIINGTCVGIDCRQSTCVVHRNQVDNMEGGGIDIYHSNFEIVNNFVTNNGNDSWSRWGGVQLDVITPNPALFMNNTVAGNLIQNGENDPGGVQCAQSKTLINSIIWDNDNDEVSGPCDVSFSNVEQFGFDGINGNINAVPQFLAVDDFHINPLSPCVDTAAATGAPLADFDGEARPQGNGVDMGADEAG